ncbi:hypothetical protein LSAT2_002897 [Lamellibrachia satsuma]|nr:hypothetical protein LSAT2_002897 [Lamellibrachia satsuma]
MAAGMDGFDLTVLDRRVHNIWGLTVDSIEKPCASVTCHNGGTCKHTNVGAWCECQPGFTGQMCDTEINVCGSNPCQNSGTCKQTFGQYDCDCVAGYHGIKCEIVDNDPGCSLPCQNSGQCKSLSSGYTCDCRPGTTGRQCETDIDECSSSPCENNATCSTTQADVYLCKCTPRYTGYNCETVVYYNSQHDQLNRGCSPGDLSTQQASSEMYYKEVDQIEEPQHSYANLFGVAGKIFRTDRCKLSYDCLQQLMFVKCNQDL